jgi:hypothetical protein
MKTYSLAQIIKLHDAGDVLFTKPAYPTSALLEKDTLSQKLASKWESFINAKTSLTLLIEEVKLHLKNGQPQESQILDDRDEFEIHYKKEQAKTLGYEPDVFSMREGDGYGVNNAYLNGYWKGWQAKK